MDEKQKKTDVSEIQKMLDGAIEQAMDIRKKALFLNDRAEKTPDSAAEEKSTVDVGVQLKDALTRLQEIQREAFNALDEFV